MHLKLVLDRTEIIGGYFAENLSTLRAVPSQNFVLESSVGDQRALRHIRIIGKASYENANIVSVYAAMKDKARDRYGFRSLR